MSDEKLADFLATGLNPIDVPPLADLLQSRPLINAFITLFHGNEEQVLMRLMVLREIGARGQEPRWSPSQLEAHFAYVNSIKLRTVLGRLRENGLLLWDGDEGLYQIAETGRVALAAVSTLLAFSDQDAELGYLTSQAVGQQQMGRVTNETLQHLLARLNELYKHFEDALESQSEFQIQKAQKRLESVWRWVQKGTEVIRAMFEDENLERRVLDQVQAIGMAQSRILRLTGSFQRRLNQLQAQRVHLGASGLTSSDIAEWLRTASQSELADMARNMLCFSPQLALVTAAEMVDVAEFELIERERVAAQANVLPDKVAAPALSAPEAERLFEAESLYALLAGFSMPTDLFQAVVVDTYPETAYRLSLLSLLGDAEAALEQSIVGDMVKLPLRLNHDAEVVELDHPEVAAISRGELIPLAKSEA
ncbi:hypothetical protein [Chitinimonas sp. BJB300]|uniref:hypothetical protein n=1 Tax=Chitinimonas sp. BJB300 TaxID=1559339 RepID=UPI000C10334B|nr:hypothetical protein [Chitinimonas sp. BJB300]PHV10546.1 hypothetical protein CSQ89_15660 [Chitinimonas sp. BJB300]TSJ91411.1 hypothetical protein FG002_003770 [Chitinimonas sp. BJB300]